MKVLLVSNKNPYFHNTNYYRFRAIQSLGHQAVFFNVNDLMFHPRLQQAIDLFELLDSWWINERLVAAARREKPDVCIVAGGVEVSISAVKRLRKMGIPCVLWTSDPPLPQYFSKIIAAAPYYDRVFCAGTEAIELLASSGFQKARWLPFACDPTLHCPVELTAEERDKFSRAISFVGSYYDNRREVFESLVEFKPGIWGPGWNRLKRQDQNSPLLPFAEDCRLDYHQWLKIYSAAKMVLVVHYQDGKIPCYQASPKLFEAMASGSFVLCDQQRDAQVLFTDKEHLVFFHDAADLKEKIRYYLDHPEERARIAAAGRAEVIKSHTFEKRMMRLLEGAGRGQ